MASQEALPQDAAALPPGTVHLFSLHESSRSGDIILVPAPSGHPDDALGWPMWRKLLNYAMVTAISTALFTGLSVQTVFWAPMVDDIDVSYQDLANGQAIQLVGLAVGCIFFIPFTKKYGRRSTYIVSTIAMAGSSWWNAYMQNRVSIYLSNMLFGLAGATNATAVQMSIRDMFFVHQRGTANSIYFAGALAGTFLMPMAAGAQAVESGWRSSYLTLAAILTGLSVVLIFVFEETKFIPEAIPEADAISIHEAYAEEGVDSKSSIASASLSQPRRPTFRAYLHSMRFLTPTNESIPQATYAPALTAGLPHVMFSSLQLASGICWLVVLSSMTSVIFSAPPYNFDPAAVGYMFGGPCVGTVFGTLYGGYFADKMIVWLARRNGGVFEAEMRLYLYPLPAAFGAAGLIMFGATADRGMHWIYPSIGGALFAFSLAAVSDIAFTLVLDAYPNLVAQTFVIVAFFQNGASIAGPFTITPWMDSMGITNMFITAGCLSLLINMLAIPLVIWGRKARVGLTPWYTKLSKRFA